MFKLITNSYSVIEFILLDYLGTTIKNFKIKVISNGEFPKYKVKIELFDDTEITQDVIDAINEFVVHENSLLNDKDKINITIKF